MMGQFLRLIEITGLSVGKPALLYTGLGSILIMHFLSVLLRIHYDEKHYLH